MPQIQLPIFPTSCTAITQELAFEQREGSVYYFYGQLISNGNASQYANPRPEPKENPRPFASIQG